MIVYNRLAPSEECLNQCLTMKNSPTIVVADIFHRWLLMAAIAQAMMFMIVFIIFLVTRKPGSLANQPFGAYCSTIATRIRRSVVSGWTFTDAAAYGHRIYRRVFGTIAYWTTLWRIFFGAFRDPNLGHQPHCLQCHGHDWGFGCR